MPPWLETHDETPNCTCGPGPRPLMMCPAGGTGDGAGSSTPQNYGRRDGQSSGQGSNVKVARRAPGVAACTAGRVTRQVKAVRRHAAEDLGATGPGRLTRGECNEARLAKTGTSVERCLRNALKAGAPVGCTSARAEVTASGAGRVCDEESFVGSAALGCIKVPSGAGKTEIPA